MVYYWKGRFSSAQIHIALRRRWPLLVPNHHQVEDCLESMEKQRLIKCVIYKHSKIYEVTTRAERERPAPAPVVKIVFRPLVKRMDGQQELPLSGINNP